MDLNRCRRDDVGPVHNGQLGIDLFKDVSHGGLEVLRDAS